MTVVLDETEHGFGSEYAFIYSDSLVIISQVTPVTIQNKNHLEIITDKVVQIIQFSTRNA